MRLRAGRDPCRRSSPTAHRGPPAPWPLLRSGWTIRSRSPWITRVGTSIWRSSAVRSPEAKMPASCRATPSDVGSRSQAMPAFSRTHRLVERKSVRGDVTERAHRAIDRLATVSRWLPGRHPPPRRQCGTADARRTGGRHDRGERAHPARIDARRRSGRSFRPSRLRRSARRGTRARPADRRCRAPCRRGGTGACRCRRAGSPTVCGARKVAWRGPADVAVVEPDRPGIPARRGWRRTPPARCASAVPARRSARPAVPLGHRTCRSTARFRGRRRRSLRPSRGHLRRGVRHRAQRASVARR